MAVAEGVFGSDGLRVILDDVQTVLCGNLEQGLHVAALAEEVHGNDGAGARGDGSGNSGNAHVEGVGVDVDQHGGESQKCDDFG